MSRCDSPDRPDCDNGPHVVRPEIEVVEPKLIQNFTPHPETSGSGFHTEHVSIYPEGHSPYGALNIPKRKYFYVAIIYTSGKAEFHEFGTDFEKARMAVETLNLMLKNDLVPPFDTPDFLNAREGKIILKIDFLCSDDPHFVVNAEKFLARKIKITDQELIRLKQDIIKNVVQKIKTETVSDSQQ